MCPAAAAASYPKTAWNRTPMSISSVIHIRVAWTSTSCTTSSSSCMIQVYDESLYDMRCMLHISNFQALPFFYPNTTIILTTARNNVILATVPLLLKDELCSDCCSTTTSLSLRSCSSNRNLASVPSLNKKVLLKRIDEEIWIQTFHLHPNLGHCHHF